MAAARMTHAASFASGGMVTRITSSSAADGVLSGLPRYARMLRAYPKMDADGWRTLVIWECETKNTRQLESRLKHFLS
jgi:hypothetical protein